MRKIESTGSASEPSLHYGRDFRRSVVPKPKPRSESAQKLYRSLAHVLPVKRQEVFGKVSRASRRPASETTSCKIGDCYNIIRPLHGR